MKDLENKINILESKSKNLKEQANKKEEEIKLLKEKIKLQYDLQEDDIHLKNKIQYIKKEIQELNQTEVHKKIAQLLTYIYIKTKADPAQPYHAEIDIGHEGKATQQQKISLDLIKGILGEDLASFIDKKIPVTAYRYKDEIIELSLRDRETTPSTMLKKRGLQRAGVISKLDNLLNKLKQIYTTKLQDMQQKLEQVHELKNIKTEYNNLLDHLNYINATININQLDSLPFVKNKILILPWQQTYQGYCLCLRDELIVKWLEGNWYNFIFSNSKTKPMKFESIKTDFININRIAELTSINIDHGDYISLDSGYIILKEKVDEIFSRVENGIEIFPSPTQPFGIKIRKGISLKREAPKPRHWGQEYLNKLATGEIIEGEFFSTGFYYQAFPIDPNIVVEANEENRATYIFNKEEFEQFRSIPRIKIILEKPKGYKGRIIHGVSRENWKKDLEKILKR